jgi:hypothetical protein
MPMLFSKSRGLSPSLPLPTKSRLKVPPSTAFVAAHLALLLAADVSMAVYFARKALRLGMPLSMSIGLWVGVLNGAFALFLVLS